MRPRTTSRWDTEGYRIVLANQVSFTPGFSQVSCVKLRSGKPFKRFRLLLILPVTRLKPGVNENHSLQMEDSMSGLEPIIIYTAGGLTLSLTALRFLLHESSKSRLCKRLIAEVRAPLRISKDVE